MTSKRNREEEQVKSSSHDPSPGQHSDAPPRDAGAQTPVVVTAADKPGILELLATCDPDQLPRVISEAQSQSKSLSQPGSLSQAVSAQPAAHAVRSAAEETLTREFDDLATALAFPKHAAS